MVQLYKRTLISNKKERTTDTCNNVSKSQKHSVKQPDSKGYILMGVQYLTVVLICMYPVANDAYLAIFHVLISHVHIYSLVKHLSKSLGHFLNWVIHFLIEFWEFLYTLNMSFIKYIFWKHFLCPVFNSLNSVFQRADILNFYAIQVINFFYGSCF